MNLEGNNVCGHTRVIIKFSILINLKDMRIFTCSGLSTVFEMF